MLCGMAKFLKENYLRLTFIGHKEQPCSFSEEAIGEHNTKEVRIPGSTPEPGHTACAVKPSR